MAAMTAVLHAGSVTTQAASVRAGFSAAISECLHENVKMSMLTKEGAAMQTKAASQAMEKNKKNTSKAEKNLKACRIWNRKRSVAIQTSELRM